ncbi:putative formyltransferase protein [Erythrobacter sp. NAP1]|uniref:formyl transferase n=1 Tax=Erythrobacter sp. NAP1 TaxID=237727 RepID=UPI0000686957|nr:formyl transferase [Erythrobacter sp. NAP1]EAQ30610.1 putative formyltransferase protein [Erythrobacter sp. NAP1]
MKRLVIITGDGREHKYVTNALCEAYDVAAILVCDPPAKRSWKKVLKRNPDQFLGKALRGGFLKVTSDRDKREASLARVLGKTSAQFDREDLVQRVGRPKAGRLLKTVEALQPDVLAIYGTGMIPDDVLESATDIALNMHTGISPHYRGVSCAMWPILDERPDMVGATVHECTSAVDGGKVFFTGRASLQSHDDLHAVFGRAVEVGAQGYVKVVGEVLDGTAEGAEQDHSIGTEYRGKDLNIWTELESRRALKRLRKAGRLAT